MSRACAVFPILCLAWALSAGGNTETERLLREQVRLHPESFQANHLLGEFLIQQHKLTAAIALLKKARRIDPSNYGNSY
ncbi:MAG: hypothetical protein M3Z85_18760, partial [Acidobacteriota bacterium]|nr:hypothetical protein [Acidobacteriota bacterium]